jgi:two-component system response regulator AtoC
VCNQMQVLVVTKDNSLRNVVEGSLETEGYRPHSVSSLEAGIDASNRGRRWDALVLDTTKQESWDEASALDLLERIGSRRVCVLADWEDRSRQARADAWRIRCVIDKPLTRDRLDRLLAYFREATNIIDRVTAQTVEERPTILFEELEAQSFFLAKCPVMLELHKNIRRLASVDHPILILGESGVGKEIVARLLHKYQSSPDKKFINVNTAAIPTELLESELFGYEAGAFTGALKAKPGKFELANEGTLLLDEIGEMSPLMQAKLLHVLQDGTFTRLGGRFPQKVDARILTATNVNMETAIAEKKFREDLYYRISTFTLHIPPLRERREEIPLLIEQMALRGAASAGQEPPIFSRRLIDAAQEYHWPGNLRELRNFVIRLLVLQDEDSAYKQLRAMTQARVGATDITRVNCMPAISSPPSMGMKGAVSDLKHQVERTMIREALLASGWNRRRAASSLNISYRALLYKIQQHGLSA